MKVKVMANKRKKVFFLWLVSNFSILLVPITISIVIYIESYRTIVREVNTANGILLEQIKNVFDSKFSEVNSIVTKVSLNTNLEGVLLKNSNSLIPASFGITRLQRDLKAFRLSNMLVSDICIYLHRERTAVTCESVYRDSLLDMRYANLMDLSKTYHYQDIVNATLYDDSGGRSSSNLAIAQSLPVFERQRYTGTLIITINQHLLQEMLNEIVSPYEGYLFIMTEDGSIAALSSNGIANPCDFLVNEGNKNTIVRRKIAGREHFQIHTKSEQTGWEYYLIIPSRVINEKVGYIRKLICAGLLLCACLGSVIAYLLARKNYRPLKDIMTSVLDKTGNRGDPDINEFSFLQGLIGNVLNENRQAKTALSTQSQILRKKLIEGLLLGSWSSDTPVEEFLSDLDIRFCSYHFAAVLFHCENVDTDNQKKSILSVMDEYSLKYHQGWSIGVRNLFAYLVCIHPGRYREARKDLFETARELSCLIKERNPTGCTVGISTVHSQAGNIAKAYSESEEALAYGLYFGNEGLVEYETIKNAKSCDYQALATIHGRRLYNFLKAGESDRCIEVIDTIFAESITKENFSLQAIKVVVFQIFNELHKAINDVKNHSSDMPCLETDLLFSFDHLITAERMTELKQRVVDITGNVCAFFRKNRARLSNTLGEKIKAFVCEHYADPQLCVNSLSQRYNITAAYMSRQFREQMGQSLLDFINSVRIEKVIYSFRTTDLSVAEIGKKAGYTSVNTFIRIFKKYEGVTPGSFRETIS